MHFSKTFLIQSSKSIWHSNSFKQPTIIALHASIHHTALTSCCCFVTPTEKISLFMKRRRARQRLVTCLSQPQLIFKWEVIPLHRVGSSLLCFGDFATLSRTTADTLSDFHICRRCLCLWLLWKKEDAQKDSPRCTIACECHWLRPTRN